MGFFSQLTKAAIDLVALPIDAARDAVSLGGVLDDRDESYTSERLRRVGTSAGRAYGALDEDDRPRVR